MEFVRLLHPKNFDHNRQRFNDLSFKRKPKSTLSIISMDCIRARNKEVCCHILEFYKAVTGDPPIFWIFSDQELPPNSSIVQKDSESGDKCHHDVDANDNDKKFDDKLYKIFKKKHWSEFLICDKGKPRPLTEGDIQKLAIS